jgi:hypothetical protein
MIPTKKGWGCYFRQKPDFFAPKKNNYQIACRRCIDVLYLIVVTFDALDFFTFLKATKNFDLIVAQV